MGKIFYRLPYVIKTKNGLELCLCGIRELASYEQSETHMTPPPKQMRQENKVIIIGFCWDSESEIQPFLTPMSGRIPGD